MLAMLCLQGPSGYTVTGNHASATESMTAVPWHSTEPTGRLIARRASRSLMISSPRLKRRYSDGLAEWCLV